MEIIQSVQARRCEDRINAELAEEHPRRGKNFLWCCLVVSLNHGAAKTSHHKRCRVRVEMTSCAIERPPQPHLGYAARHEVGGNAIGRGQGRDVLSALHDVCKPFLGIGQNERTCDRMLLALCDRHAKERSTDWMLTQVVREVESGFHTAAQFFRLTAATFGFQYPLLHSSRARPVFAAFLLRSATSLSTRGCTLGGYFIDESLPRQQAVAMLRSTILRLHLKARGHVLQCHRRAGFVYVLTAGTGGAREGFFELFRLESHGT